MSVVAIVDNLDAGYSEIGGGWSTGTFGTPYGGNDRFAGPSGTGTNKARFQFTGLIPGATYTAGITFVGEGARANNTPWKLLDSDGTTILQSGVINQSVAPDDFATNGRYWEKLGDCQPSGTTLTIEITDAASGYVIADACVLFTGAATTIPAFPSIGFFQPFSSLTGWTNSGVSLSSGTLVATTGGTQGYAVKEFSGIGATARLEARIYVDKTDTAGRKVAVFFSDATYLHGMGIIYVAGTGFRATGLFDSSGLATHNPVTIVADASLSTGWYKISVSQASALSGDVRVRIFDSNNVQVGQGTTNESTAEWRQMLYAAVVTNSAKCKVDYVTFDTNIFGSANTVNGFTVPVEVVDYLNSTTDEPIYWVVPGNIGNNPSQKVVVYCQGAGGQSGFADDTNQLWGNHGIEALKQGYVTAAPLLVSGNGLTVNHWSNAYAVVTLSGIVTVLEAQFSNLQLDMFGYSMGGEIIESAIGQGVISPRHVTLLSAAVNLNYMCSDVFPTDVANSRGHASAYVNSIAQHSDLDSADPMLLVDAHPTRYSDTTYYVVSFTPDSTVSETNNTALFVPKLVNAGARVEWKSLSSGTHLTLMTQNQALESLSMTLPRTLRELDRVRFGLSMTQKRKAS